MNTVVSNFEQQCAAAGVKPQDALTAGGVHKTNWWRWKRGDAAPNYSTLEKANDGLKKLRRKRQAS